MKINMCGRKGPFRVFGLEFPNDLINNYIYTQGTTLMIFTNLKGTVGVFRPVLSFDNMLRFVGKKKIHDSIPVFFA